LHAWLADVAAAVMWQCLCLLQGFTYDEQRSQAHPKKVLGTS
jgi:hypothetical protein